MLALAAGGRPLATVDRSRLGADDVGLRMCGNLDHGNGRHVLDGRNPKRRKGGH